MGQAMCNYYVGQTANGQTIVYYVADGVMGQQAMREIRRRCEGGNVKAVTRQEAMALTRADLKPRIGNNKTS